MPTDRVNKHSHRGELGLFSSLRRAFSSGKSLRMAAAATAMDAKQGVLVTGDAALCQHILHVDEQAKDPSMEPFVIEHITTLTCWSKRKQ